MSTLTSPSADRHRAYDFRNYQAAGSTIVLFDIRRHVVTVNGTEPTLAEAENLYRRWFGSVLAGEKTGSELKAFMTSRPDR